MVSAVPKTRKLNSKQFEDLNKWLNTKKINLIKYIANGNIELNSVVSIMKIINKKAATPATYATQSNFALKLKNWENFNLLVLRNMGVTVTRPTLEQLANGEFSALHFMLHQVMCAERKGFQAYVPRPRSGTLISSDNQVKTVPKQEATPRPPVERPVFKAAPKPKTSSASKQAPVRMTAAALARQTLVRSKADLPKEIQARAKPEAKQKSGNSKTNAKASIHAPIRKTPWECKSFKDAGVDCDFFYCPIQIVFANLEARMDSLNETLNELVGQRLPQSQTKMQRQKLEEPQQLAQKEQPHEPA